MKSNIMVAMNEPYAPLLVRIVEFGDRYGKDFCLYHKEDDPLVEFYDMRYPHTVYGQFVSRYCASTLLDGRFAIKPVGGLCLDGGNADTWSATEETMSRVVEWLKRELS